MMLTLLMTALAGATPNSARRSLDLPDFEARPGPAFTEMVAMSDGTRLHTRVALPEGEGPWPVVFLRTPYPMDSYLDRLCARYVRYAYACVYQHVRGQRKSEGEEWNPFRHERADGLAALAWIIDQDWSADAIGMMGPSYMGGVQWAMADVLPPEVKTIVPSVFGLDMYANAYQGGMFRHELLTAWMTLIPDRRFRIFAGRDYQRALAHRPRSEADLIAAGVEVPWYREWVAAQERSAPLWQSEQVRQAEQVAANTTVPVLVMGGWSDIFIGAQLHTWGQLASQSQSTLVIGPWDHLGEAASDVPLANIDDKIGLQDSYIQSRRTLDWFDHHLKGRPAQFPVGQTLVYTTGAHTWSVAPSWPPPTEPLTLQAGTGDAADCTAALGEQPGAAVQYTYDPADPTPSLGGAGTIAGILSPGFDGVPIGLIDQGSLCADRSDMLGWQSTPLAAPVRVAGPLSATLTVSSSAPDTAFNVRITEIRPDGEVLHVREGIRALSFRDGDDHKVPYTPGESVSITVETWPIDHQFQAGSRIQLQVASASFPKFEAHSNTTDYWADAVDTPQATQTVHAATLTLPVVADIAVAEQP